MKNWIFRFSIVFFAAFALLVTHVAGATDLTSLARPAIKVKAPDKAVLIAIANAGNRLVAVGEHGVIIYSDDSGKGWRQASVPVDVTLTAVGFETAQDGWAAGHEGVILHTSDGGTTWQMKLNGFQVNTLTMQTAQAAVADNDPSPGTSKAILRANHFLDGGPENPFLSILTTGPNDATVVGAYRIAMKTSDGGQSWTDWSLHVADPVSHNLYDIATVGTDIYIVGEAGSVFRSTDAGATFPQVTTPADSTLFWVVPAGTGGVFVGGVAGLAFLSADSGKAWKSIDLGTQSNLTAADVLSSGSIVVGSEAGGLYVSKDEAKTFSMLPEVLPMEIFALTQAEDGDVVTVGSGGVIVIPAESFSKTIGS